MGSNDWFTAGNWTPNGVPTSSDAVTIANSSGPVITTTGAQAGSVTLTNDATTILTVQGGGTLATQGISIGYYGSAGNTATATVTGTGSVWTDNNSIFIGQHNADTDTLNVLNGGVLNETGTGGVYIGNGGTAVFMDVSGAGSSFMTNSIIYLGHRGLASMTVENNATVTETSNFIVGNHNLGTLNILTGGAVSSLGGLLGNNVGYTGIVTVDGTGSQWNIGSNGLQIGVSGLGTLTVSNGGSLSSTGGITIASNSGSTGTLNIGASSTNSAAAPGSITSPTITFGAGTGTLTFNHTSNNYSLNSALSGNGSINVLAGTTILTGNSSSFSGTTSLTGGTLDIGDATHTGAGLGGNITMGGGTLSGFGSIGGNLTNTAGTVSVGGNSGTLHVGGNYSQAPGGMLVVGVTDSTHYGQLIVTGSATLTNSQVLLVPANGISLSGKSITIVQAASSGTDYTGVNVSVNGFTAVESSVITGGLDDLVITFSGGPSSGNSNTSPSTYMKVGQQTAGSNGSAVGAALDQLETSVANGGNVAFVPVLVALNTIGAQQGVVAEGAAIKQLAPGQLSASVGATNLTAMQTMTVIGQHQQNLRSSGSSPVGRAAGSEYTSGALWMQVSGGFANSTTAGAGYHQSYYGITFGADDRITKNALLGLAVGWSHNNAQGANDLSGDSVTTSTPELMGYGTYRLGQAYLDGMLGVGYNMFTQSRSIGFLNSVASSSYDGMQYMGNVEAGYDFAVTPRTTMTPLAGFNAVRTDTNSYTETGAGPANTSVGHQIIDSYATLLGGRLTTAVPTLWGSLLPEVRLAWEHDLNHSPISSNANLGGVTFATSTPRSAQDGAELTLAATLQHTDALSLRAEYDGDLRSDFQSHTGQLKGSWKF